VCVYVWQIQTTKGTGGCCIILEEAAYVDPGKIACLMSVALLRLSLLKQTCVLFSGFFYETVAPLLLVGRTSLLAISTLTSEFNFYTRLFKMYDKATLRPIFHSMQIELACAACQADGKTAECKHMLHLMPQWQSSERMIRLQTIMSDRPDLIESELSGIASNTLQSCFRGRDIATMFEQDPLPPVYAENLVLVIDPAAGGPQSDYAMVSMVRRKGMVQVRCAHFPSSHKIRVASVCNELLYGGKLVALPRWHHLVGQCTEEAHSTGFKQWHKAQLRDAFAGKHFGRRVNVQQQQIHRAGPVNPVSRFL
jgi:hypothetical protein